MFLTGVMSHALEFEVDGVLYSTNEDGESTVTASHTTFAEYRDLLVVPADVTYDGASYKVTRVGDGDGAWRARHIVLSEGIEEIGDRAFTRINGVRTIDVPCSVVKLGSWAFHGEYVDCECEDAFVPQEVIFRSTNGLLNCGGQSAIELFGVLCDETKIYIPKGQKQLLPASFVDEIRNLIEMDFDYAYVPLVREGVQWVNLWQRAVAEGEADEYCVSMLEFRGTQEVEGMTYHKLYFTTLDKNVDEAAVVDEGEPVALMREDAGTVYSIQLQAIHSRRLNSDDTGETLAYDFNEPANSFLCKFFNQLELSSSEVVIDGLRCKRHVFASLDVVEQVGYDGEDAMLLPFKGGVTDGSSFGLAYVRKDGRVIYEGKRYNDYLSLHAADYEYVPLVREGVQWVHFWSRPWALDPTDRLATPYVYEFSGTEEIGGEEYAKLYGYLEGGSIDETEEPMAYVRERDKVVYRRWDKVGPDEIIYDFNNMANAVPEESRGEWYENGNYTYVVEDIVVDGRLRKMHNFDGCVVIEGVGALNNNASIMDGLFPAIPSDGSSNGLSHVVEHGDIVVEGERRADYLAWGSGDANGDGLVNGADVTALYAYLLCTPDDDEYPFATIGMDLNRDGYLSGADVTALYNLLLN